MVHVNSMRTALTKPATKPWARAHSSLWRISPTINKNNMLTAVRWRTFITHVQTHMDQHRSAHTQRYIYALVMPFAARGECDEPVTACSSLLHALCKHVRIC